MVLRVSRPTTDDLEVPSESVDPVPNSCESIKEQIDLCQAMEIHPLDLQRSFKGVLDGRRKLG